VEQVTEQGTSVATGRPAAVPARAGRVAAIEVRDLVKRYPKRPVNAVDGISFEVRTGEIFGLLGPNGAGKTTTVGVLTTRVTPTAGTARVAGIDVAADPVGARRRLAVVPQGINLDRSLTARQNLVFHAAYHGVRRKCCSWTSRAPGWIRRPGCSSGTGSASCGPAG
jgi:ABC-type multidrug transport system ATPase subunit